MAKYLWSNKCCSEIVIVFQIEEETEGIENFILMTSVTVPAYDRKTNQDNRSAELLGVAGTDVPIEDIEKLVNSHKVGLCTVILMFTKGSF